MQHALGLSAVTVFVLASLACGSDAPAAHTNEYVSTFALKQVEADLGPGAVVVSPVDENPNESSCTIDGVYFSSCLTAIEQPPELHVASTLCELKPDEPTTNRFFVECREAGHGVVIPAEIPHCPGHG
jgi:hypothetical protein